MPALLVGLPLLSSALRGFASVLEQGVERIGIRGAQFRLALLKGFLARIDPLCCHYEKARESLIRPVLPCCGETGCGAISASAASSILAASTFSRS